MAKSSAALLCTAAAVLLLVPQLRAQSRSDDGTSNSSGSIIPAVNPEAHYTWVEAFDGSSNTTGQVMSLDSTVGYDFNSHFAADAGLPVYFVRPAASSLPGNSTNKSFTALGDFYARLRLAFPSRTLNFKTQLTGRAPTGSTSDGISTGHYTYDWTNRIDRRFGPWTPFFEVGLADSIPESFIYRRPFVSYGELSHFQLGTLYRVNEWLGLAASGFDIAPWGSQTISSRVTHGIAGAVGKGHFFQQNAQTIGGASLAADNGFSAGLILAPFRTMDFILGYSRSTHYHLNTFSFGVSLDMAQIVRRASL